MNINYYNEIKKQDYYTKFQEKMQIEAKEYLEQTLINLKKLNKFIPINKEQKDKIGKAVVEYIKVYEEKLKTYKDVMNRFYKNNDKNYAPQFYKMATKLEEIIKDIEKEISQLTLKYIKYFIEEENSFDIKI